MELATYCSTVCGGKCCYLRLPDEGEIRCPNLRPDNTCGVYEERYAPGTPDLVVVGYWRSRRYVELNGMPAYRPFWCGRIHQIHAAGGLPSDVAAQCAAIHPHLLEEKR